MIRVSDLTKRYGQKTAVDGVSFSVGAGEVVGFLGPNGAGKSTTLRVIAGFLAPTSGQVTLGGFDVVEEPLAAKKMLGYMPETVPLYPEMRVVEYLAYRAELKGVPRAGRAAAVDEAMTRARVDDVAGTLIGRLSKGYRQRVGFADALVAKPPVLVLDEPTAGLDPNQIRDVRATIRELGRTCAVLLSTHILSEVEASCDRVLVLGHGKLLASGPTAEVARRGRARRVVATVRGAPDDVIAAAKSASEVRAVELLPRGDADDVTRVICTFDDAADVDAAREALAAHLVAAGLGVRELGTDGGGLEEVFAALTQGDAP